MDTKGSSCKYALIAILFIAIVLISCVGVELNIKDQEQPIVVAEADDNIIVMPKYAAVQEKEAYNQEEGDEPEDTKDETSLLKDENAKLGAKAFMQSIVDGSFIKSVITSNVVQELKEEISGDVFIEVWALESSGDSQSGEEVENEQIEETTAPASTQEIVQGPPTNYVKVMKVNSTAYCLCKKCCGKSPSSPSYGRTASGLVIVPGTGMKVIAVDPSVIPLGTKVYVDGYGYAVAADTGGAIKQNRIDVYMDSHSDALKWGRKNNINLYILPN